MNPPSSGMPGMPPVPMTPPRTSGLAIAGFICAFVCSPLGFILSLLGYNQVKSSRGQLKGSGFAVAGMAISGALFVVGILATVAVPAFINYMKKAKTTEAQLQLNKLGKNAKVYFVTTAEFPIFDQPLTPPASCCSTGGKCPVSPSAWQTPAWQAMDFEIDEPHLYRYSFKGTKDAFEATAVGDLDCDGVEATYHLHVTTQSGNPVMSIDPPSNGER